VIHLGAPAAALLCAWPVLSRARSNVVPISSHRQTQAAPRAGCPPLALPAVLYYVRRRARIAPKPKRALARIASEAGSGAGEGEPVDSNNTSSKDTMSFVAL